MIESQVETTVGVRGAVARQTAGKPSMWKRGAGLALRRIYAWLGRVAPDKAYNQLAACVQYMTLGRWMKSRGFSFPQTYAERSDVFAAVARQVADKRVLYLEFGVFKGDATRWWSNALRHPEARLHGFDSFEGLPDSWNGYQRGHFATGGVLPLIDDRRVRFWKGWFNETLPKFEADPHDTLVLIMDADLYGSTSYVLKTIEPLIRPGAFIYFDDLHTVDHDARAFDELAARCGLRFEPIAATHTMRRAFFRCV
jgi:predicted O-methyltransferase YrrM